MNLSDQQGDNYCNLFGTLYMCQRDAMDQGRESMTYTFSTFSGKPDQWVNYQFSKHREHLTYLLAESEVRVTCQLRG